MKIQLILLILLIKLLLLLLLLPEHLDSANCSAEYESWLLIFPTSLLFSFDETRRGRGVKLRSYRDLQSDWYRQPLVVLVFLDSLPVKLRYLGHLGFFCSLVLETFGILRAFYFTFMDSDQVQLFEGGISWETNEDTLKDHFNKYGNVMESVIMRYKSKEDAKGFGFVLFSDPSAADKVLQDKHAKTRMWKLLQWFFRDFPIMLSGILFNVCQVQSTYHCWADKIQGLTIPVDRLYHMQTLHMNQLALPDIILWNFPLLMYAWKVAPAFTCGNSVVLKTAEQTHTQLSALYVSKLFHEMAGIRIVLPWHSTFVSWSFAHALLTRATDLLMCIAIGTTSAGLDLFSTFGFVCVCSSFKEQVAMDANESKEEEIVVLHLLMDQKME
ncbi:hypothetical protein HHK36_020054 [Tetracentron sinense]|uniref:RRM domain-containing protein n=1 Tax=Tetracentron sinense TaxID=13715 RepID=A0A835D8H4_TETSI|nr:hypothetical protein HHK36_020054 [Tetracentron sinense]